MLGLPTESLRKRRWKNKKLFAQALNHLDAVLSGSHIHENKDLQTANQSDDLQEKQILASYPEAFQDRLHALISLASETGELTIEDIDHQFADDLNIEPIDDCIYILNKHDITIVDHDVRQRGSLSNPEKAAKPPTPSQPPPHHS